MLGAKTRIAIFFKMGVVNVDVKIGAKKLSDLDLITWDWDVGAANVNSTYTDTQFRSGRTRQGTTLESRSIKVSARFLVDNVQAFDDKQREINSLFSGVTPVDIHRIYTDEIFNYSYTSPDEAAEIFSLYGASHLQRLRDSGVVSPYFFRALPASPPNFILLHVLNHKYLYEVTLSFVTDELPFELKTFDLGSKQIGTSIGYQGTHQLAMRDHNWKIELTATSAANNPSVTIGAQTWRANGGSISSGSKLVISATQSLLDGYDITSGTNFVDFTVDRASKVTANFAGTYRLINALELYL